MMKFIAILFLIASIGCNRDVTPSPKTPTDNSIESLNVIWKDTMTNMLCWSIPLFEHQNELVFSYNKSLGVSHVQKRDPISGAVRWESDVVGGAMIGSEVQTFVHGNTLYHNEGEAILSMNLNSGSIGWKNQGVNHFHSTSLVEHIYGSRYRMAGDSLEVIAIHKTSGIKKVVFKLGPEGSRYPVARAMTGYVNENGDEVLLVGVNMHQMSPSNRRSADIYCYNVTEDTLIWKIQDIEDEPDLGYLINMTGTPKIDLENGLVYFHFAKALYCLNIHTGAVVWDHYYANTNMLGSNHILHEDKIVLMDDMGYLIAHNRFTGALLYRTYIDDSAPSQIGIWRGNVVVAHSRLQLLDINTGEQLREILVPASGSSKLISQPLMDEINKRMYLFDGYAIVCAKIPDSWLE